MKERDMYLPNWLLCFGLFCIAVSVVCLVLSFVIQVAFLVGFVILATIGIFAVVCHQNQWAAMTDEASFVYSTMFGNRKQYRFSEIRELRQHADSMTLVLENGKVHIESCAVLSERFAQAIDKALYNEES